MIKRLSKPKLVFGEKGEREYFAVEFDERVIGSTINAYIRRTGEPENKDWDKVPYHTWLLGDAPEWARILVGYSS